MALCNHFVEELGSLRTITSVKAQAPYVAEPLDHHYAAFLWASSCGIRTTDHYYGDHHQDSWDLVVFKSHLSSENVSKHSLFSRTLHPE